MRMLGILAAAASLASASSPMAVAAQEGTSDVEDKIEISLIADRLVVTGKRVDYKGASTATATKTDTPLVDIPQSLTVLGADLIADQSFRSIADVVRYTPGVLIGQGEGHRDQITLRGNNTTADFFLDGVRDDVQYYRNLYNLERIEILKGPNALIFGRGGGGGVVNRVLKRPTGERFAAAEVSADTFGGWRIAGDANAPIANSAGLRLNAFYESSRNHRDQFELERYAANPTFRWQLGATTTLDLSYEYAFDDRLVDRGVPSLDGRPLEGFDSAFLGEPDVNRAEFEGHFASAGLTHEFSGGLKSNTKVVYGVFDKFYRNAFPATPVTSGAGGVQSLGVEAYFDPTERRNFFIQNDLVWDLRAGPFSHKVLVGAEIGDQRTENERINGFFDSGVATTSSGRRTVVPLSDPLFIPPIAFRAGPGNRAILTEADVYAAYVQDQAKIGKHVELLAGVRYDRFKLDLADRHSGASFTRTDGVFSPRGALIVKPAPTASLYGSYSRSFLPQSGDQFLSLDASLAALEPEKFDNYEVGAKWDISNRLSATMAVYRLDRTNTRAPGAAAGSVVATGAQRSRGLEVGLVGAVTDRLSVLAGYTIQEAEITRTTSAAPAGRKVPQAPRHHLTVWGRYDLSDRFGFGLGIQRQGESFASISNAVVLPAYTRVDAALYLALNDRVEAQVNVHNLFDTDYFPTAHNDNNITVGEPLSALFTIRARL